MFIERATSRIFRSLLEIRIWMKICNRHWSALDRRAVSGFPATPQESTCLDSRMINESKIRVTSRRCVIESRGFRKNFKGDDLWEEIVARVLSEAIKPV